MIGRGGTCTRTGVAEATVSPNASLVAGDPSPRDREFEVSQLIPTPPAPPPGPARPGPNTPHHTIAMSPSTTTRRLLRLRRLLGHSLTSQY